MPDRGDADWKWLEKSIACGVRVCGMVEDDENNAECVADGEFIEGQRYYVNGMIGTNNDTCAMMDCLADLYYFEWEAHPCDGICNATVCNPDPQVWESDKCEQDGVFYTSEEAFLSPKSDCTVPGCSPVDDMDKFDVVHPCGGQCGAPTTICGLWEDNDCMKATEDDTTWMTKEDTVYEFNGEFFHSVVSFDVRYFESHDASYLNNDTDVIALLAPCSDCPVTSDYTKATPYGETFDVACKTSDGKDGISGVKCGPMGLWDEPGACVEKKDEATDSSSTLPGGAVAGIAAGGVLLLAAIVGYVIYSKNANTDNDANEDEDVAAAQSYFEEE